MPLDALEGLGWPPGACPGNAIEFCLRTSAAGLPISAQSYPKNECEPEQLRTQFDSGLDGESSRCTHCKVKI